MVFVWPNRDSNPRSTTIEASTPTIPPPMRLKFSIGTFINIINKKWAQISTATTWPWIVQVIFFFSKFIPIRYFVVKFSKLFATLPFYMNFRGQIENQVSDYRLLRSSSLWLIWFDFLCLTLLSAIFLLYHGGRSWSTKREPPTMSKQLVSFITCGCESSVPFL